tara:strand:- start:2 stop:469 length:468 start_codon:yes stop_codon:yes gene_type:complete
MPPKSNKKDKKTKTKKNNAKTKKATKSKTPAKPKKTKTHSQSKKSKKEEQKVVMFLIYAKWCPHCTHMKPEWDSMKEQLQMKYPARYSIEEIEHSDQDIGLQNLENRYAVNRNQIPIMGYPTMGGIKGGKVYQYNGARDKKSFIDFATTLLNSSI